MIFKGVSDIKGISSIHARPGPTTESAVFLQLYRFATEKENLLKKMDLITRQKNQTQRRILEITHVIHMVEKRANREPASSTHAESNGTFIEY